MTRLIPLLAALLLAATPMDARVRRVPQDLPTLQAAVDSSLAHGDTVLVDRGVWTEQVRIGPGHLTLASNHLVSGDTLDIEETILDGGFERTILFAEMDPQSELCVTGFTIRRALSRYIFEEDHTYGGGLHFETAPGRVRLAHLVFRDNRGSSGSAVWYAGAYFPFNTARFELMDINCFDNYDPSGPQHTTTSALVVNRCAVLHARHLFVRGSTAPGTGQYGLNAKDTLTLAGFWATGITDMFKKPLSLGVDQYGWADIRDLYFTHNHSHHPGSLSIGSGAQAHTRLRNVHVSDNFYEDSLVDETSIGPELTLFMGYATLDAESLFVCRNRVENCGQLLIARSSQPATRGWIRNLEVVGNYVGSRDSHALDPLPGIGSPIFIEDISLQNAVFRDNILETPYWGTGVYSRMNSWCRVSAETVDSLTVRNVLIENLQHIDNDQYRPEDAAEGGDLVNFTRGLFITATTDSVFVLRHLELDSVVIHNSRINLILPETDVTGMFQSTYLGSTMSVGTGGQDEYLPTATLRNILLNGCDDGGLTLFDVGWDVELDNVAILNTQRRGLLLSYAVNDRDTRVQVRNLLIKNIQQEEFHRAWPYPLRFVEQSALLMGLFRDPDHLQEYEFSNISILDCDVPILIQTLDDYNLEPYVIYNSLIAGNTYDFLTPWWPEFSPTHFVYSAVQEEVMGEHNLLMDDPGFDPVLGSPWLAEDSPCVDAGDPSRPFDDREDPDRPGQALWPGRGTTRNDIGYTGGPAARVNDYVVSVPPPAKPLQPERPVAPMLHPAAPNPFNPVTTLSFTLERPGRTCLDLYDLSGACVRRLDERARGRGAHTFILDAKGLPSGVYFVELSQGGERSTQKVLLLK